MNENELREKVKQLINRRPYYICRRGDDHCDLHSQVGPMAGEYSRLEDKQNEEYLEDTITKLVQDQCASAKKARKEGILYATGPIRKLLKYGSKTIQAESLKLLLDDIERSVGLELPDIPEVNDETNKYTRGYSVGYMKALADIKDMLYIEEGGVLRLDNLIHWIEDQDSYHRKKFTDTAKETQK